MTKVIIEKLSEDEISERGIRNWPVWDKEVSIFPAKYIEEEECLILEGEFIVETSEGSYKVKAGDFITFKAGLDCVWDIKSAVKKHYNFK